MDNTVTIPEEDVPLSSANKKGQCKEEEICNSDAKKFQTRSWQRLPHGWAILMDPPPQMADLAI